MSTRFQNPTSQVDALNAAGCDETVVEYASGKLARHRPEWDQLNRRLRAGDQLVITRLSRLARSVRHLTELAADLQHRQVDLQVLHQGIDTSTSTGRFTFHVLAALDELTADLISEGTHEGLAAARARGRRGGRPTVMTPGKLRVARQMLAEADRRVTLAEVARTIGVGRATLYRHLEAPDRAGRSQPAPAAGKGGTRPTAVTTARPA